MSQAPPRGSSVPTQTLGSMWLVCSGPTFLSRRIKDEFQSYGQYQILSDVVPFWSCGHWWRSATWIPDWLIKIFQESGNPWEKSMRPTDKFFEFTEEKNSCMRRPAKGSLSFHLATSLSISGHVPCMTTAPSPAGTCSPPSHMWHGGSGRYVTFLGSTWEGWLGLTSWRSLPWASPVNLMLQGQEAAVWGRGQSPGALSSPSWDLERLSVLNLSLFFWEMGLQFSLIQSSSIQDQ